MIQTPYRAVFFDLDGTLLPMELEEFLNSYFTAIGTYVAAQGVDINSFKKGFKKGIESMTAHDGRRSNAEVYWEAFFSENDPEVIDWDNILACFYEHEFGKIGDTYVSNPAAAEALTELQEKGYPMALTTMPLFPLRAVQWRLSWAGIDHEVFDRITYYENSTSVKPKLAYYQENLDAAGLKPSEVLMVGNNTKEDLACLDLGIDAYLVTDNLLNPNDFDIDSVKHGTFDEFLAWVKTWVRCSHPCQGIQPGLVMGNQG